MTPPHLRIASAALLLAAALLTACGGAPVSYTDQIASWRAEKDRFMRESPESPVPEARRAAFAPLKYFPVDPSFRVPAGLTLTPGDRVLEMPTSTGEARRMRRVGTLGFTLQGREMTLSAFIDADQPDMRRLFVPFGDLTNGVETYPGGRYLDLDRTATGIYDLDFNKAYHPFCFYNPKYDCPYPPPENRLRLAVRAGERK
ncbi:MAG TPA: DUF1684 domain-containing protein [Vicinamibacterales bacterium]|nr:DUF1684 domain-containing protein [Vicinamibacterales bacterium]